MNFKNEVAVGVLFTAALVILGYFTIMVKNEIFEPRDYYFISVSFPSVEGVEKGDDVRVNGVKSGVVDRIVLENEYILVYLKMFSKFTMFQNYRIKIASESVLSGKLISIYPGARFVNGKHYEVLESRTMLNGISADDPIALLSQIVVENKENVYLTLKNIQEITSKINNGKGTLGTLINSKEINENANNLMSDLRETLEDAREQAPVTSFIRAALTAF